MLASTSDSQESTVHHSVLQCEFVLIKVLTSCYLHAIYIFLQNNLLILFLEGLFNTVAHGIALLSFLFYYSLVSQSLCYNIWNKWKSVWGRKPKFKHASGRAAWMCLQNYLHLLTGHCVYKGKWVIVYRPWQVLDLCMTLFGHRKYCCFVRSAVAQCQAVNCASI